MKLITACAFFLFATFGFAAEPAAEIEALLGYVGSLEGATFIRNSSSHSAAQAVSHLRLKWQNQAKRIKTAEDFIRLCASSSSISGDRYRIRLKDGTERYCDDLLKEQLTRIRQTAAGPAKPKAR